MTPHQAAIASQHYAAQHYKRACINREFYIIKKEPKYKKKFEEHMHISFAMYSAARFFMGVE